MHALESWLGKLFNIPGGPRLSVLIYHRVLPEADPLRPGAEDRRTFDCHMRIVSRYFEVLPLGQAVLGLRRGNLPRRALCVTFDDGYQDNVDIALPILRRYGLCATFFIASGYVDGGLMWNDVIIEAVRYARVPMLDLDKQGLGCYSLGSDAERLRAAQELIGRIKYLEGARREDIVAAVRTAADVRAISSPMMSRGAVATLHDAGMEIGGHTVSHPILNRLPLQAARSEIADGKEALEAMIGEPIELFAYPNGRPGLDYGPEHVRAVKDIGFIGAVSTARGVARPGADSFQIPRFTPWDHTPIRFMARLADNALRHSKGGAACVIDAPNP